MAAFDDSDTNETGIDIAGTLVPLSNGSGDVAMTTLKGTIVSTTTLTPVVHGNSSMTEAWNSSKGTLAWLVPLVVVVSLLLVILSVGLVYIVRSMELWFLKCCYQACGCCPPVSRRLHDDEYTHLTDALHENEAVALTDFKHGEGSSTYRGNAGIDKDD